MISAKMTIRPYFLFLLLLFPFTSLYAQGTITYIENFADTSNGWFIGDTPGMKGEIKNSRYYLEQKNQGTMSLSWSNLSVNENSDFQIETSVKFLNGADNFGFGLLWGLKEGDTPGFYSHMIAPNGSHCVMKYAGQVSYLFPWKESPLVSKGSSPNTLMVKKSGNMLNFFINNQQIGSGPVQPFLGNRLGLVVGGPLGAEFFYHSLFLSSDKIPAGWSVVIVGNTNSGVVWDNLRDTSRLRAEIHKGSDLTVKSPIQGKKVVIQTQLKSLSQTGSGYAGIYLHTQGGDLLRLVHHQSHRGTVVKFSLSSKEKDLGGKEITVPGQEMALRLSREGDAFKGEVITEGKTMKVGSLKWPNLPETQEAGLILHYRPTGQQAPPSLNYEFSNISITPSSPAAYFQTSQPVRPVIDPPPPSSLINVAGTTWLVKDSLGEHKEYYFNTDGSFHWMRYDGNIFKTGTWKQNGHSIYFETNKFAEYMGNLKGPRMEGAAKNAQGREWTWSAELKR
jgi:hypothetical protein